MRNKAIFIYILLVGLGSALANPPDAAKMQVAKTVDTLNKSGVQQQGCVKPEPSGNPSRDETEDWRSAGFGNPSISSLDLEWPESATFTHEISFTMVQFRKAGWTEGEIKRRYLRVAQIYSQCGIKVGKSKLVTVDAPNGWLDTDYNIEKRDQKISKMVPPTQKPILFYVRSNLQGQSAYAWQQSKGVGPAMTDTVWMTAAVHAPAYKKLCSPLYNEDAHELGHIYGNCEHTEDGSQNFLANDPALLNDKILPEQCENMKQHYLVRPI
jgi:hypothetical protein